MDTSEFETNSLSNTIIHSPYISAVSDNNSDKSFILGIDEAGRGPVLGQLK